MKFFVTGRSNNYQRVVDAFDVIEKGGHKVTLRWTDLPMIKPYAENPEKAAQYATQQVQGVLDSDVYVLFAHEDGTGVFTEFGAALARAQETGALRIFAIGDEYVKGKAMFHFHPAVQWVSSLEEVFESLGI